MRRVLLKYHGATKVFFALAGLLLFVSNAHSQPVMVSGNLFDKSGNTLEGVEIQLKGTDMEVKTDAQGRFELMTMPSSTLLVKSANSKVYEVNLDDNPNFSLDRVNLMLSASGIVNRYWCCTSHQDSPHCHKNRSNLKDTHSEDEVYKIKNPEN